MAGRRGPPRWVLVVVGIFFWPLILVGLLCCQEERWRCLDCGEDAGRPGSRWDE